MAATVEEPAPLSHRLRLFSTIPGYTLRATQTEFLSLARICEQAENHEGEYSALLAKQAALQAKLDNALTAQRRLGWMNICFLLSIWAHEYLAGLAAAVAELLQ